MSYGHSVDSTVYQVHWQMSSVVAGTLLDCWILPTSIGYFVSLSGPSRYLCGEHWWCKMIVMRSEKWLQRKSHRGHTRPVSNRRNSILHPISPTTPNVRLSAGCNGGGLWDGKRATLKKTSRLRTAGTNYLSEQKFYCFYLTFHIERDSLGFSSIHAFPKLSVFSFDNWCFLRYI